MDTQLKAIKLELKRVFRAGNHKHPNPQIDVESAAERLILLIENYAQTQISAALAKERKEKTK